MKKHDPAPVGPAPPGPDPDPAGSTLAPATVAVGGMTAALAVAFTHALAGIPNVELTSLTLFTGGAVLGWRHGAGVGVLAAIALSLTSPMGPPNPVLLVAQCLGYGLWGACGGLRPRLGPRPGPLVEGLVGMALTLVFQLLVNASLVVAFSLPPLATLAAAAPYALVHVAWNTFAFAALGPPLLGRVAPLRERLATLAR